MHTLLSQRSRIQFLAGVSVGLVWPRLVHAITLGVYNRLQIKVRDAPSQNKELACRTRHSTDSKILVLSYVNISLQLFLF